MDQPLSPPSPLFQRPWLLFVLLLIAVYFPLFLHLENLSLRIFDESRLAVNALEMTENGNLLVTTFNGEPDMWNLKPPLMIWLQAAGMKIFGYNELAVRLPSALFGLGCVILLFWFCANTLRSPLLGFISGIILITSQGFVSIHVTRTGEYDAMLCFFMLAQAFAFFRFLHREETEQVRQLYLFGLYFTLAVLSKGIAGAMLLPGLTLYALLQKQLLPLLRSKHTYFVMLSSAIGILAYYLGREIVNPGYLWEVWDNEIGGRYNEVIEAHRGPFNFYFERLWEKRFWPWMWWLPLSVVVGLLLEKKSLLRAAMLFSAILATTFLLIISAAQTKLNWYDAPAVPWLALLVGLGIYQLVNWLLQGMQNMGEGKKWALLLAIAITLFGFPYTAIIQKVYQPKDTEYNRRSMLYGSYMKHLKSIDNYFIAQKGYNAHLQFYVEAANKNGQHVEVVEPKDHLFPVGSVVVICEDGFEKAVRKNNQFRVVNQYEECLLVEVTGNETTQNPE